MLMGIPLSIGLLAAGISRGTRHIAPRWRSRVLWLSSPDANHIVLLGFGILLMVFSLVLTLSRSGILALASGLVLTSLFMSRRETSAMRRFAVIGYLTIVFVIAASWVGLDQIAARFAEGDLASVNQRPAIWADTLRIIRDFWLTGSGFNTFGIATLFYQTSVPELHLREAHNDYLQLAAEGGVLMGIPILIALVAFAAAVRRRFREDVGSVWWIRMGAVTGILAVALQSLVEFSLQMPGNAALFTVLCGIALHDSRNH
jgi:O-antigen ligase